MGHQCRLNLLNRGGRSPYQCAICGRRYTKEDFDRGVDLQQR